MNDTILESQPRKEVILLVEDEQVLRETLGERLVQEGYEMLTAENGARGLQLAHDRQPDLILLDIRMPRMSGFEMLKTLREQGEWGKHVPVVFLTNIAPTSDDEVEDIQSLKPTDYILKGDTSLDEFVEKVRFLLKK
jgi:DNA-binding response OmpR family regulator